MFIDPIAEDAATGDVAEYYREQKAAWGFLPNYAGAFTRVLDGLGAQLDTRTAQSFAPELLRSMIVGRPPAAE